MLSVVICVAPMGAFAVTALPAAMNQAAEPDVFITELQTTGSTASEEFIEFYNNTDHDVDFADQAAGGKDIWKVQFFSAVSSASGTPDWTKPSASVSLNGVIAAHDYYLISASGYAPGGIDADQVYSSRLSDSGGAAQLVDVLGSITTVHDNLLWKQPAPGQSLPPHVVGAPAPKGSLQRTTNDDSEYVNADNSLTDILAADSISPKDAWAAPAQNSGDTGDPADSAGTTGTDAGQASATNAADLAPPQITELLPNPASPQTDDADEYIELYNPNAVAFNLKGYRLEVGTSTLHDFTFTADTLLSPAGYTAFYSADTRLSLSNSGGQARLLDPSGRQLDVTAPYEAAADGMAWGLGEGSWQWTSAPTPGAANILDSVPAAAAATTLPKALIKPVGVKTTKTAKKTATTASAKLKGVKTTKATTKKTSKPKKKAAVASKLATAVTANRPIHNAVLAAVALAALLYGLYEYRHDLANKFHQLREYRAARRTGRSPAARRRSLRAYQ